MQIKQYLLLIAAGTFLLVSCRSVDMYSQVNPQWKGQPLKRVMVIGNFDNMVYRHYAEGQMCEYIGDYSNTKCLQSLNYVFAGHNQKGQIAEVLNKEKVDGVIYISTQASGTKIVSSPIVFFGTSWASGFGTAIGYGGTTTVDWAN